jgi:hypothetical protein
MKRNNPEPKRLLRALSGCAAPALLALVAGCGPMRPGKDVTAVGRLPDIFPLSHGTVIPPNIAPLNFKIMEPGNGFFVSFSVPGGRSFDVSGAKPGISIPQRAWQGLLSDARGRSIAVQIFVRNKNEWRAFATLWDTVASDECDPIVAYRKIPVCKDWTCMGMFQRDVRTFHEELVFQNRGNGACLNCHSFLGNSPAAMALEVRSKGYGTPMVLGEMKNGAFRLRAVNTKTQFTTGKVGLSCWHPSGTLIAFTMNKFEMLFYSSGAEPRAVFDASGDVALFDLTTNEITTCPALSAKDRIETMPEWSRDGRFLYFCSGPQLSEARYREIRCDLMRIAFDPKSKSWGALDTVLTALQAGGSVLQPRMSPDSRRLLVNIAPYGDFPVDKVGTRLALLDPVSPGSSLRIVAPGTPWSDSWHGWSSNGRWIVFNSKRLNGRFSTIMFSYVDSAGIAHRPFALPQKDPCFYESSIVAYNLPECLTQRIPASARQFRCVLDNYRKKPAPDAKTGATVRAAATGEF